MSVQAKIDRIKANIASAYAKAAEKGAELPPVQNSENLPAAIEAIPAGGMPEGLRIIILNADPPEGGSVSGGGVAQNGMTVTVSAEANESDNYLFDGWKKGGAVVHEEPVYTFSVAEDICLVAAFYQPPYKAGVDWFEATMPSSAYWQSVAYGNGKFVAVAYSSNKAAYSADGISWTAATLPSSGNWYSVTYGNGKFVAVKSGSDKAAYSSNTGK